MAKYAGFGAILALNTTGSTYVACAGVKDISGPGLSQKTIDATTHDSPDRFKECVAGVADAGSVSFDIAWEPADAADQAAILACIGGTVAKKWKLTFPDAAPTAWTFTAFVTGFEPKSPVDGLLVAAVKMEITGKPSYTGV